MFLLPICVTSDYELDVDWPVVLPDFPDNDEDYSEEDDEEVALRMAA